MQENHAKITFPPKNNVYFCSRQKLIMRLNLARKRRGHHPSVSRSVVPVRYLFITCSKNNLSTNVSIEALILLSSPSYTSVSQISPSVESSDYKTLWDIHHKSSLISAHLFYSIGILLAVWFFLRNPCSDRVLSFRHFSTLFLSNSPCRCIRRSTQARLSFSNLFGVHFSSWFYFCRPQGTKYLPLKLPNLVLVRSKLQAKVTYLSR